MPRLTQAVPKYRSTASQASVTIDGRDHLLGPRKSKASKVEYDRLIGEWLASGRSASYGAPKGDDAIVELAADYMRRANGYSGDAATSEWRSTRASKEFLTWRAGTTATSTLRLKM